MIKILSSKKKPKDVFTAVKEALGNIGKIKKVDSNSLNISGNYRYGLQNVKVKVQIEGYQDKTSIKIEAISDDVLEKGAKKAIDKLIFEIKNNLLKVKSGLQNDKLKSDFSSDSIANVKNIQNDVNKSDKQDKDNTNSFNENYEAQLPNIITLIKFDNQQYYVYGFIGVFVGALILLIWKDISFIGGLIIMTIVMSGLLFLRYLQFKDLLTKFRPKGAKNFYFLFSKIIHNRSDNENYLESFLSDFSDKTTDESWLNIFKKIPQDFFPNINSSHCNGYSGSYLQSEYRKILFRIRTEKPISDEVFSLKHDLFMVEHEHSMGQIAMSSARVSQITEKWSSVSSETGSSSETVRGTAFLVDVRGDNFHYYTVICGSCDNEMYSKIYFAVGPNACSLPYKYPTPVKCNKCGAKNKIVCS